MRVISGCSPFANAWEFEGETHVFLERFFTLVPDSSSGRKAAILSVVRRDGAKTVPMAPYRGKRRPHEGAVDGSQRSPRGPQRGVRCAGTSHGTLAVRIVRLQRTTARRSTAGSRSKLSAL